MRGGVIVDEHEKRNLLVMYEGLGVAAVTGPDRNDVGAEFLDLLVSLAQLRGMFAAVQSTEMSEEHQHDRLVLPQATEPMRRAGLIHE